MKIGKKNDRQNQEGKVVISDTERKIEKFDTHMIYRRQDIYRATDARTSSRDVRNQTLVRAANYRKL